MEHENGGDTNCNKRTRYSYQRIDTGTEQLENERSIRDHANFTIVEIGQNSSGPLKRLAVTQTPDENSQLPLAWKTL